MTEFDLPRGLASWAEASLAGDRNILARSNQGTVLLFREAGMEFVIKTVMGRGTVLHARRATLEREWGAYRRLEGVEGVPKCYGMLEGRFLVLQHIRGTPYREAEIADRPAWFARLLDTLRACHERGVAHGDLKNKSNLMSDSLGRPCIIDFGTTVLRKDGFHPVNHRFFDFLRQLDLNAWCKHKYEGRFEDMSSEDRAIYHDSLLERLARRWRQSKGLQGPR